MNGKVGTCREGGWGKLVGSIGDPVRWYRELVDGIYTK